MPDENKEGQELYEALLDDAIQRWEGGMYQYKIIQPLKQAPKTRSNHGFLLGKKSRYL